MAFQRIVVTMALEYLYKNKLPENLDAAVKHLGSEKPRDLYSGLIETLKIHTSPAEIISEEVIPPVENEESTPNVSGTETPIEYPTIYSPLNFETVGSNYNLLVNHENKDVTISTFFTGELTEEVKNYAKAKVDWLSVLSKFDLSEVPIAVNLLTNTGFATKVKCLDRLFIYSKSRVYGEAYNKLSDAQFAATGKPKGSNNDAIKKWTSGRNRLTGSLEMCQFDKIDMIFDVLNKNSAVIFAEEEDFLVWEVNCSFNGDKGKYEPVQGGLKQPNEMVDFYAWFLKN